MADRVHPDVEKTINLRDMPITARHRRDGKPETYPALKMRCSWSAG